MGFWWDCARGFSLRECSPTPLIIILVTLDLSPVRALLSFISQSVTNLGGASARTVFLVVSFRKLSQKTSGKSNSSI